MRADKFCAMYADHIGLKIGDGGTSQPSGAFVDWDTAPGWPPGRDYIFHGKETR
jgi:hypothetical protein